MTSRRDGTGMMVYIYIYGESSSNGRMITDDSSYFQVSEFSQFSQIHKVLYPKNVINNKWIQGYHKSIPCTEIHQ